MAIQYMVSFPSSFMDNLLFYQENLKAFSPVFLYSITEEEQKGHNVINNVKEGTQLVTWVIGTLDNPLPET